MIRDPALLQINIKQIMKKKGTTVRLIAGIVLTASLFTCTSCSEEKLEGESSTPPAELSFDDPNGVFVLNEGNMTTENGSLTYITPKGEAISDAYKLINGTELGNVSQDMCIHDGKIYIISQNGDHNPVGTEFNNDGLLVIADAHTLKKIDAYKKEELKGLTWPSHIAVLDEEHVYIRDNGVPEGDNGSGKIWCLNTKDRSLTEVQNTIGVPKSPLYVRNGKVYTYFNTSITLDSSNPRSFKINYFNLIEISTSSNTASVFKSPAIMGSIPVNIVPAQSDNVFWILLKKEQEEVYLVGKVELLKGNYIPQIKSVALDDVPNSGSSGVMLVSPSDDTFYYTSGTFLLKGTYTEGTGASSYLPEISIEEMTDLSELDSNARIVYNGMGIHPKTGHLYINTIRGMGGLYTTNTIWEFDPAQGFNAPVHKWSDYTRFPAGFFFPIAN